MAVELINNDTWWALVTTTQCRLSCDVCLMCNVWQLTLYSALQCRQELLHIHHRWLPQHNITHVLLPRAISSLSKEFISQACSLSSAEALLDRAHGTSPRAREVCKCRCWALADLACWFGEANPSFSLPPRPHSLFPFPFHPQNLPFLPSAFSLSLPFSLPFPLKSS